jgi:hypothetical protein
VLLPKLDSRRAPLPRKVESIVEPAADSLVKMPSSVISLFSELDKFQAALREDGGAQRSAS